LKILITGAAGNLGTILAKSLLGRDGVNLRLMFHSRALSPELLIANKSEGVEADLADPRTLVRAVQGVDQIIHFAGVLFRAQPERFLPQTNREYFRNLLMVAGEHGIHRIILISFPHVEGPTSFDSPARGRLDGRPISVHANIGRVSYYGDTSRFRSELVPKLMYKTFRAGIQTL
jgi:nucleoside-diphosphate-sugar epimerase